MPEDSKKIIIFWQNCISIHQYPLLNELHRSGVHVIQVVESELLDERAAMGWGLPEARHEIVEFTVGICDEMHKKYPSAKHVFTGFNGFKKVAFALQYFYRRRPKSCYVFQERPDFRGLKGKVRYLLYAYYCFRYREVAGILAAGAREIFSPICRWNARVYSFPYYVYPPKFDEKLDVSQRNRVRITYVGSLISRKNIRGLCDALSGTSGQWELVVIGDGQDRVYLDALQNVRPECKVKLLGVIGNSCIGNILHDSDCLILPSNFDGYGVVVNEAALCGIRIICSNMAGASEQLRDMGDLGGMNWFVNPADKKSMIDAIDAVIAAGTLTTDEKDVRRRLAETLHPMYGSNRLLGIMYE